MNLVIRETLHMGGARAIMQSPEPCLLLCSQFGSGNTERVRSAESVAVNRMRSGIAERTRSAGSIAG